MRGPIKIENGIASPSAPSSRPPFPGSAESNIERATVILAQAAVLLVGMDIALQPGFSATLPAALVVAPIWLRSLRIYSFALTISVLGAISVAAGFVLSELAAVDHTIDQTTRAQSIALLLSGLAALGLLLWAREHLPLHRIVALYGLGSLLSAVSTGNLSWKFDLAVPTIFLALGVVERVPRPRLAILVIVVLGSIGIAYDGRSLFALCLLAALLTFWQKPSSVRSREIGSWLPAILLAGFSIVIYALATALMTGGYLGSTLQERSTAQIETAGTLIAGGRPEWSATRELMSNRPEGYGPGVVPSWSDYMTGKSGLASINVDTGGYAKYYLFGGQFKLHSIVADLWVSYGLVGLAMGAVMVFALIRSLSTSLARGDAPTSVIFACVLALWCMLFGPIYSNWLDACVALGFILLPRGGAFTPDLRKAR